MKNKTLNELENFDINKATCYDPNEKLKLLTVIKAVGIDIFQKKIRKLGSLCRNMQEAKQKHFFVDYLTKVSPAKK